jgi:hypothetical protein
MQQSENAMAASNNQIQVDACAFLCVSETYAYVRSPTFPLSKYSKYNLNHLNILIAVLWLCCANIVVVGIKMSDFSLESDDSLSSLSDSSGDDLEELLEDRVRPKNENYFEETIPQYNEQEFMEHFRVSRQVANSIAERFEMSDYFKPQSGCYGKLSTSTNSNFFMVCRASDCKF